MTLNEFVKKYENKSVDWDSAYGSQCVDLFRFYVRDVLNLPQPKGVVGAKDFYFNFEKDEVLKNHFIKIPNDPQAVPQAGDVVVWDRSTGNQWGHVAIFLSGDVASFVSLDQNWDFKNKTFKVSHNYLKPKVLGWLRAKKMETSMEQTFKKKLSEKNWNILKEFEDLRKARLIIRDDSIQTMTQKWLETNRKQSETINTLFEEEKGLKSQITSLQGQVKSAVEQATKLQKQLDMSAVSHADIVDDLNDRVEDLSSMLNTARMDITRLEKQNTELAKKLTNCSEDSHETANIFENFIKLVKKIWQRN